MRLVAYFVIAELEFIRMDVYISINQLGVKHGAKTNGNWMCLTVCGEGNMGFFSF